MLEKSFINIQLGIIPISTTNVWFKAKEVAEIFE